MTPDDEVAIRRRFARRPPDGRPTPEVLAELVADRFPLLDAAGRERAVRRLLATIDGLGPLDPLLRDERVTDVLVNGPGPVWVERDGELRRTDTEVSESDLALLIDRAFRRQGLSVDRSRPIGDTRLPDGARLSVVLPPLAIDGVHLAIRRFAGRSPSPAAFGDEVVVDLLHDLVRRRANIVVFGPTGAGKTTLVGALSALIDRGERVITIEDAAELRLDLPHVVRLECRPDNGEGAGGVTLRELVRAALRLRPDRLVVGEVRGAEALDMVWALATGHRGSISTCHAASAADALARLETFVLLADAALGHRAVRSQVRAAVDVLVGVGRVGPSRSVTSVHEVVRDVDHPTGVQPVWELR